MNDELKEILDALEVQPEEFTTDYSLLLNIKQQKVLLDYITNLQQKVEQYENPDDLTLFYMWLDEKSKDKMKELQQENEIVQKLKERYQLKKEVYESRIDKAIEYIEKGTRWFDSDYASTYGELCDCEGAKANRLEVLVNPSNLLDILKGGSNE